MPAPSPDPSSDTGSRRGPHATAGAARRPVRSKALPVIAAGAQIANHSKTYDQRALPASPRDGEGCRGRFARLQRAGQQAQIWPGPAARPRVWQPAKALQLHRCNRSPVAPLLFTPGRSAGPLLRERHPPRWSPEVPLHKCRRRLYAQSFSHLHGLNQRLPLAGKPEPGKPERVCRALGSRLICEAGAGRLLRSPGHPELTARIRALCRTPVAARMPRL